MLNKVQVIGNLGSDPETRTTSSGMTIANLRIATNERVKKDGEWTDHTEWHRVVCFGSTADAVARYLSKGRQVYVEGKIRTREWEDKEGQRRWTTEIVADSVQFLGGKDGASSSGNGSGGRRSDSGDRGRDDYSRKPRGGSQGRFDDDVPF